MGLVESLAFHPPDRNKTVEVFSQRREVARWKRTTKSESGNEICMLYFNYGHEYTVLYSHGNAEDIGASHQTMRKLSKQVNVNLCCYDYSGYGLSTGTVSEENCYKDIEAVYKFLTEENGVPENRIILFGRSIGTGPTTHLASKKSKVAGLVLQSPICSIIRTVFGDFGAALQFMDIFKNITKLKPIDNYPVLVIHGKQDNVVPFDSGKQIYKKLSSLKRKPGAEVKHLWLDRCGHNDIEFLAERQFYEELRNFLQIVIKYAKTRDDL